MITREQVEKLKQDWLNDPCWDLGTTEGFEAYWEELEQFATAKKAEWDAKRLVRDQKAANEMGLTVKEYRHMESLKWQAKDAEKRAAQILWHYLGMLGERTGRPFDGDCEGEIRGIAADIVEASVCATQAALLKAEGKQRMV